MVGRCICCSLGGIHGWFMFVLVTRCRVTCWCLCGSLGGSHICLELVLVSRRQVIV